MRFTVFAAALALAGGGLAGEAAAMRLATFEFEGVTSSIGLPGDGGGLRPGPRALDRDSYAISGRFTLDLDASLGPEPNNYPGAVKALSLSLPLDEGTLTGQQVVGAPTTGLPGQINRLVWFSDGLTLGGDQLASDSAVFALGVPLNGPITTVASRTRRAGFPEVFSPVTTRYDAEPTFLEIIARAPDGTEAPSDLTVANILALADLDLRFQLYGLALAIDPSEFKLGYAEGFGASGSITSLTEVGSVPLPAAAWLMLSGLAALAGFRVWPRTRGSGGAS